MIEVQVYVEDSDGEGTTGKAQRTDTITCGDAVELCYRALLAVGFQERNIADAMYELSEEYYRRGDPRITQEEIPSPTKDPGRAHDLPYGSF